MFPPIPLVAVDPSDEFEREILSEFDFMDFDFARQFDFSRVFEGGGARSVGSLTPTLCRSSTLMTVLLAVSTAVVSAVGSGTKIACTPLRVLRQVVGITSFCGLVRSGS